MAPTTSTTLTLVLGDALAVALMERKGFSADQYRDLHPAGALGRALIRAGDLMHRDFPLVTPGTPMKEVLLMMTSYGQYGVAGVVGVQDGEGRLAGVITDGDLRRHIHANPLDHAAADLMSTSPKTVPAGMLAAQALTVMNEARITSLFVVPDEAPESRRPIGLLHVHDCLRAGLG
jgi:arabinose-5-phosphate isomerase